jgi:VanZ family protein
MARRLESTVVRAWLAALIWAAFVWVLGGDAFGSSSTMGLLGPLLQRLFPDYSADEIYLLHLQVRKVAHFGEYALLAVLSLRALRIGTSWRWSACAATTLAFVVALATADEARQGISAARTGSTWNVLLDVSGASVALVIVIALQLWLRRPLFPRPGSRSV